MEMRECGEQQLTWNEGCPQPGVEPKGKETEAPTDENGGHDEKEELEVAAGGVHVRAAARAATKRTRRRMRVMMEEGGMCGEWKQQ